MLSFKNFRTKGKDGTVSDCLTRSFNRGVYEIRQNSPCKQAISFNFYDYLEGSFSVNDLCFNDKTTTKISVLPFQIQIKKYCFFTAYYWFPKLNLVEIHKKRKAICSGLENLANKSLTDSADNQQKMSSVISFLIDNGASYFVFEEENNEDFEDVKDLITRFYQNKSTFFFVKKEIANEAPVDPGQLESFFVRLFPSKSINSKRFFVLLCSFLNIFGLVSGSFFEKANPSIKASMLILIGIISFCLCGKINFDFLLKFFPFSKNDIGKLDRICLDQEVFVVFGLILGCVSCYFLNKATFAGLPLAVLTISSFFLLIQVPFLKSTVSAKNPSINKQNGLKQK